MLPRTPPQDTNGRPVVKIVDTSGLTEWKDYIPVQEVGSPDTALEGTYADLGYEDVSVSDVGSVGAVNFEDYVPVSLVTGRSSPWQCNDDGYIPVVAQSGALTPFPDLYFDFAGERSLTSVDGSITLTHSRASTARYVGSDGLLKEAASGELRFGYDPVTLESLGVLIEESKTNVALQSNNLTTGWTKTRSTAALAAGISPDGTNNANSISEDSSNNSHFVTYLLPGITSTAVWTLTAYLKKSNRSWGFLQIYGLPGACQAYFDLENGVVGTTSGTVGSRIVPAGNGWYRCEVIGVSGTVTTPGIAVASASGDNGLSYQGTTQESILCYGVQCEINAATSYIPTTTATVTRQADLLYTTDVSWYNATSGSFFVEARFPLGRKQSCAYFDISDNSGSDRLLSYTPIDTTTVVFFANSNSVTSANLSISGFADDDVIKIAGHYAANDFESYANGTRSGTGDQSGALPIGVSQLNIGSAAGGGSAATTHIRSFRYYGGTLLSLAKLDGITT